VPSEIINVGKIMRQEAFLKATKRGKQIDFNVSAKAVQEEISFLKAKIESDVFSICERLYNESRSKNNMRKTIMDKDVVLANGFIEQKKREEVD
jgi:histone H3/H4